MMIKNTAISIIQPLGLMISKLNKIFAGQKTSFIKSLDRDKIREIFKANEILGFKKNLIKGERKQQVFMDKLENLKDDLSVAYRKFLNGVFVVNPEIKAKAELKAFNEVDKCIRKFNKDKEDVFFDVYDDLYNAYTKEPYLVVDFIDTFINELHKKHSKEITNEESKTLKAELIAKHKEVFNKAYAELKEDVYSEAS